MAAHVPTLLDLTHRVQYAVHGPQGREVPALIEKAGVDLRRRQVHKAIFVKDVQHRLALL